MGRDGRLVAVADTRLFVVDAAGSGYPLICLHGGPGADHWTFADYLDPLAPEVRVVLVDLRGHGRSDDADPATLTLERLAADVAELATALGFGKYAVLGHSFGGAVAVRFAADHRDAAAAVVLSAASASSFALPRPEDRVAHLSDDLRARLASARDFRDGLIAYLPACFADERDERIAEYLERRAPMVLRADTAERMRDGWDLTDRLHEVRAPTLVLHGARDRTTPLELGEQLARGIRGARLRVFAHSGHFAFVEEQQAYVDEVRSFVCG